MQVNPSEFWRIRGGFLVENISKHNIISGGIKYLDILIPPSIKARTKLRRGVNFQEYSRSLTSIRTAKIIPT